MAPFQDGVVVLKAAGSLDFIGNAQALRVPVDLRPAG